MRRGVAGLLFAITIGCATLAFAAAPDDDAFYGTVKGRVWRGDDRRYPVAFAAVQIHDRYSDRTWTTFTDLEGRYEIRGAPLHAHRPPFEITAEREGARVEESYVGPLLIPAHGKVVEKDLFIGPHRYTVTVELKLQSPFVPDGRASVGELVFRVVFRNVKPLFAPDGNPYWGCCQLETEGGKGELLRLALNDVIGAEGDRHRPWLTQKPPGTFTGLLSVVTDKAALKRRSEAHATLRNPEPPRYVRVAFRTEFWLTPVGWQSKRGAHTLGELALQFETPWPSLLAGKPLTITRPFESDLAADEGTWTVIFEPQRPPALPVASGRR